MSSKEKNKEKRTSNRRLTRTTPTFKNPYVMPTDAIDQTLAVSRDFRTRDQQIKEGQMRILQMQRDEEERKQKRAAYRKNVPNGMLLTDAEIDSRLAYEEDVRSGRIPSISASKPKGSQIVKKSAQTDKKKLAAQYAQAQSFYGAMGSPSYMPLTHQQVLENPRLAQTQLNFAYNNPSLNILQDGLMITAPGTGISSNLSKGLVSGYNATRQATGTVAKAIGQGTVQGVKNAGQYIATHPQQVAQGAMLTTAPTLMSMTGQDGSPWPYIFGGGAAALGTTYLWNKKGKIWNSVKNKYNKILGQSDDVTQDLIYRPKYGLFTWERPGNFVQDIRESLMNKNAITKEWNDAIKDGGAEAIKAFKQKYGLPDDVSNGMIADKIRKGELVPSNFDDFVIIGPTQSQKNWARTRNVGRGLTWGLGVGGFGYSAYNLFNAPEQTTQTQTGIPVGSAYGTSTTPIDTMQFVPAQNLPTDNSLYQQ